MEEVEGKERGSRTNTYLDQNMRVGFSEETKDKEEVDGKNSKNLFLLSCRVQNLDTGIDVTGIVGVDDRALAGRELSDGRREFAEPDFGGELNSIGLANGVDLARAHELLASTTMSSEVDETSSFSKIPLT